MKISIVAFDDYTDLDLLNLPAEKFQFFFADSPSPL